MRRFYVVKKDEKFLKIVGLDESKEGYILVDSLSDATHMPRLFAYLDSKLYGGEIVPMKEIVKEDGSVAYEIDPELKREHDEIMRQIEEEIQRYKETHGKEPKGVYMNPALYFNQEQLKKYAGVPIKTDNKVETFEVR